MKRGILAACTIGFLLSAGPALAGKPAPVPTVPDYDIVNFACPTEVQVNVDLVVLVEVIKYGTTDPGATIQIWEGGGCCGGPVVRVEDIVYDATDAGKQRSTTYSYNLGSYPAISEGLWTDFELHLWDANADEDYIRTCQVHVVP